MNNNSFSNNYLNDITNKNRSMSILSNSEYIPLEESFIENIIRLNKGKKVLIYQSFPNCDEWKNQIFSGIIEQAGKDHVILSDPTTGNWYLLLLRYIDFIKFEEEINTVNQFYPINN